jgi:hypothetical protein
VKPLAIWFGVFVVVVGGFFFGYDRVREANPDMVFVVVDSSFPMEQDWRSVQGVLDGLDDRRYAEFALATEKESIHGWRSRLSLGAVAPYAPRDLTGIDYPEMDEATELVLVTNAPDSELAGFDTWEIVRP